MLELFRPEDIKLDEVTNAVLVDVDQAARKVNDLRPLPQNILKRILDDLVGERVYSSNAIEGNTLDLRETREVLKTGQIEIPKKREATEALNLAKSIKYAHESLIGAKSEVFTIGHLLNMHKLMLHSIDDDYAGRFRDVRVMIHGAKHQPPNDRLVPDLVKQFIDTLNIQQNVHAVILATWAHWAMARIHPFKDANGRMARLWQDTILFQRRLTCAIIRPQDRIDYLAALGSADEGDFNALIQLVGRSVLSTLDKYLSAQQQDTQIGDWAKQLTGETNTRAIEKRKLSYLRWSRKMEQVRYEFERCAACITSETEKNEIQFRSYDLIDQGNWETLRSGLGTSKTSLFQLAFRWEGRFLRYYFFFGKHYWSDEDTKAELSEPRVTLLVSEQSSDASEAVRLGKGGFETPLSYRELFVVDDTLVRRRYDGTAGKVVYDRDVKPVQVAQDFIQEVLLRRMG